MSTHVAGAWAIEDLVLVQGVTWSRTWEYGEGTTTQNAAAPPGWATAGRWTARMQVRKTHASADVLLQASTNPQDAGQFTFGTTTDGFASVTVTLTPDDLAGATWTKGVYDLELVDTGVSPPRVERLVEGSVQLSLEVTR